MKNPKKKGHPMPPPLKELVIAVKGAGEMATAVAWKLFQADFRKIFMLEIQTPLAVRRRVSFCEAVYEETIMVAGVQAKRVTDINQFASAWASQCIPILVDPKTGIPGPIGGFTRERLLRAPCSGIFTAAFPLGALIQKNDIIGHVDNQPVIARIDGILRGLIRDNTRVKERLKIGDIDPRGNKESLGSISRKARAIGDGVLEAILRSR